MHQGNGKAEPNAYSTQIVGEKRLGRTDLHPQPAFFRSLLGEISASSLSIEERETQHTADEL